MKWHRLFHWFTAQWRYHHGGQAGIFTIEVETCAICGRSLTTATNDITGRTTKHYTG